MQSYSLDRNLYCNRQSVHTTHTVHLIHRLTSFLPSRVVAHTEQGGEKGCGPRHNGASSTSPYQKVRDQCNIETPLIRTPLNNPLIILNTLDLTNQNTFCPKMVHIIFYSVYHSIPFKLHLSLTGYSWTRWLAKSNKANSPRPPLHPEGDVYDSIFVLSSGRVTSIGPQGEFNWQVCCVVVGPYHASVGCGIWYCRWTRRLTGIQRLRLSTIQLTRRGKVTRSTCCLSTGPSLPQHSPSLWTAMAVRSALSGTLVMVHYHL